MNFIDKFLVKLVLLPTSFYQGLGIDTTQLKAILQTKIILGDRTPTGIRAIKRANQKKPTSGISITQFIMSVVLGLVFMFSFFIGINYETKLTLYFSMFMFILASTLMADFTTVLIDVRDNFIILPKPVNDITFLASRLLYIIVYILKTSLPMTFMGMGFVGYFIGIWPLIVFIVMVLLVTLLTIFFINAIYIVVLKITTPQKFKTIISYFQIAVAILIYASYQIVPRLISKTESATFNINNNDWIFLAPPYWFACAWQYLTTFNGGFTMVFYTMLSIAVPFVSIWFVIKYLAPSFNQKLAMISSSSGEEQTFKQTIQTQKPISNKTGLIEKISKWVTPIGAERVGFMLTWKMTSRSRDFKMKVYPSLGYLAVYLVLMFLNNNNDGSESGFKLPPADSFVYIFVVYFSNFVLITALGYLVYSEKYKAAWMYYIPPVDKPGKFILGSVKSILFKFYVPLVITILVGAYFLLGAASLPNFMLGVCNQALIILTIAYITINQMPFSALAGNKTKGNSFVRGLFTMLIPVSVGLVHYLIRSFLPVVVLLTLLSGIAIWMIMDSIKNKTWEQIKVQEDL